jgi:hypothetical protein
VARVEETEQLGPVQPVWQTQRCWRHAPCRPQSGAAGVSHRAPDLSAWQKQRPDWKTPCPLQGAPLGAAAADAEPAAAAPSRSASAARTTFNMSRPFRPAPGPFPARSFNGNGGDCKALHRLHPSAPSVVLATSEVPMPVSHTSAVERIARVIAGQRISANAKGVEAAASGAVDSAWRDYRDDALAILRTLREPDPAMAAAGDPHVWEAMVEAALRRD